MNRSLRILLLVSPIILIAGCNYFVLASYMIVGPPTIEPDYDKQTKKSLTDLDVKVAVVCFAPQELKYSFDAVDHNIAARTTAMLRKNHINVVNADQVRAWVTANPTWDKPQEVGEALDATHVVYIDLHEFALFEEGSRNEQYRGRSEANVSVIEMGRNGEGDKVYSKELLSVYPYRIARPAADQEYDRFKKEYLVHLADKIGRLFYSYRPGDDIPNAA